MAIYEYLCKTCNEITIVNRGINDPEQEVLCKTCNSLTKRLYSNISVSFKGSGFYSTDK
jgi:putative FmdB family regulatory protein